MMKRIIAMILSVILLCMICVTALAETCSECKRPIPDMTNFCIYCGKPTSKVKNLFTDGHSWTLDGAPAEEKKTINGVELTVTELGSMLGYSSNEFKVKKGATYHISYKVSSEQPLTLINRLEHNVSPWTKYREDTLAVEANFIKEYNQVVEISRNDTHTELAIVFAFTEEQHQKLKLPLKLRIYDVVIAQVK